MGRQVDRSAEAGDSGIATIISHLILCMVVKNTDMPVKYIHVRRKAGIVL
jgi:hypothetical protein